MEKQIIIAVGREFGSGGREIATKIADTLGIPLIDRNLLQNIADARNLNAEELEKYDEKPIKMYMSRTVRNHSNSLEENIAHLQFNYLKELAAEGKSFVILGRCASSVLRENPNLISIFVLGDMDSKVERVMKKYSLSRDKAVDKIKRHDKSRKAYHNYHSTFKWGDSRGYDICVNSSRLGVEGTADMLLRYIADRRSELKIPRYDKEEK